MPESNEQQWLQVSLLIALLILLTRGQRKERIKLCLAIQSRHEFHEMAFQRTMLWVSVLESKRCAEIPTRVNLKFLILFPDFPEFSELRIGCSAWIFSQLVSIKLHIHKKYQHKCRCNMKLFNMEITVIHLNSKRVQYIPYQLYLFSYICRFRKITF